MCEKLYKKNCIKKNLCNDIYLVARKNVENERQILHVRGAADVPFQFQQNDQFNFLKNKHLTLNFLIFGPFKFPILSISLGCSAFFINSFFIFFKYVSKELLKDLILPLLLFIYLFISILKKILLTSNDPYS